MMELVQINADALNSLVSGLVGALVPVLGFLGWIVSRRAQRVTERTAAHAQDEAAFTKWKDLGIQFESWWKQERDARIALDEKHEELKKAVEVNETKHATTRIEFLELRQAFGRLERRLDAALNYIRALLAWAGTVSHTTPHPAVPSDIAHLIDSRKTP